MVGSFQAAPGPVFDALGPVASARTLAIDATRYARQTNDAQGRFRNAATARMRLVSAASVSQRLTARIAIRDGRHGEQR